MSANAADGVRFNHIGWIPSMSARTPQIVKNTVTAKLTIKLILAFKLGRLFHDYGAVSYYKLDNVAF
jgi:hypothetical protein